MTSIQTGKHRDMYSTNMSMSTAKNIFQHVWNRPVCELFSSKDTPGFSGECHVPESLKQCSWCEGKAARPEFVHEQIVAQMAQSISGLMQVSCLCFSTEPLLANPCHIMTGSFCGVCDRKDSKPRGPTLSMLRYFLKDPCNLSLYLIPFLITLIGRTFNYFWAGVLYGSS